jgi:hypothetical protein
VKRGPGTEPHAKAAVFLFLRRFISAVAPIVSGREPSQVVRIEPESDSTELLLALRIGRLNVALAHGIRLRKAARTPLDELDSPRFCAARGSGVR